MSTLKLYSVSGPPSLSVQMLIKALHLPNQIVDIDFGGGEHLKESFAKINPQKELPCLDDDGFILSESVAILQYIADKYAKDDALYPKDPRKRAVVNHRLLFNLSTYYKYIAEYVVAPVFYKYAYKRTPAGLKKMNMALSIFNTYFEREGTRFVAGETLTIADFALIASTSCLESIEFSLAEYPLVAKWYESFKKEYPEHWDVLQDGMLELRAFNANPPDLSGLNHPLHPPK